MSCRVINKLHEEKEEARKTLIEHEKTQKQLEVSKKCNPGLQIEMDFLTRLRQKVGIGQTQNESLQLQNQNKELPQQIASKKSADDSNWNKLRSELKLLRSELELKNQVANENKRALDELKQESQKEGEKLKEKNQSYLKEIERLKSASREGNKVKNPPRGPDKTVRKRRTCNVCKEVCKYPIPPNPNCLEPIPNCNGSGQQIYCKYYYLKAKANKVAKL